MKHVLIATLATLLLTSGAVADFPFAPDARELRCLLKNPQKSLVEYKYERLGEHRVLTATFPDGLLPPRVWETPEFTPVMANRIEQFVLPTATTPFYMVVDFNEGKIRQFVYNPMLSEQLIEWETLSCEARD